MSDFPINVFVRPRPRSRLPEIRLAFQSSASECSLAAASAAARGYAGRFDTFGDVIAWLHVDAVTRGCAARADAKIASEFASRS